MADRSFSIFRRRTHVPALILFVTALPLCCSPAPASYPDKSGVVQAQAQWCASLAKLSGAENTWEHMADCKAAYPASSAEYLTAMTKCFATRWEDDPENAADQARLVGDCTDEVTMRLPADGPGTAEVLNARCDRMKRCEEVSVEDCRTGVMKLETAQKAIFTTTYNAAALHEIAGCLDSDSCTEDEEAARQKCYQPFTETLLWFPR